METRFLVVGSGYAGTLAALRLARRAGAGAVTLVDPELRLVERVRLHEAVARGREVALPLTPWVERLGIRAVRGQVVALEAGRAQLHDGTAIAFEQAIVATGSRIQRATPGSVEHALPLEPAAVPTLRARLERAGHVVVIGGGLTGIEMASELAEATPSRRVTLVTSTLGPALSPRARDHVRRTLERLGVSLRLTRVERIEATAVQTREGHIACDLVIDTSGFAAAAPLHLSGPRDPLGRVVTDPALRTREGAILAGDLAVPEGDLAGAPMIRGCQSAMPMGAHAADVAWALASGQAPPAFSFAANAYCVSLGRRDGVIDAFGTVLTGRLAAWIKEGILRYTVQSMHWQARGWDYRWRRSPRPAPARLVAASSREEPA